MLNHGRFLEKEAERGDFWEGRAHTPLVQALVNGWGSGSCKPELRFAIQTAC